MFVEILPEIWTRARDVQAVWCQGRSVYYQDYDTDFPSVEGKSQFSSETAAFHWVKNVVIRLNDIHLTYPSS